MGMVEDEDGFKFRSPTEGSSIDLLTFFDLAITSVLISMLNKIESLYFYLLIRILKKLRNSEIDESSSRCINI